MEENDVSISASAYSDTFTSQGIQVVYILELTIDKESSRLDHRAIEAFTKELSQLQV